MPRLPRMGRPVKRSPIRRKSTRKAREDAAYTAWRAGYLDGAVCELCFERPATEIHHRRFRSAGGHLTLPANCARLCSQDHEWVHANPTEAHTLGWIVRQGDPEWDQLAKETHR